MNVAIICENITFIFVKWFGEFVIVIFILLVWTLTKKTTMYIKDQAMQKLFVGRKLNNCTEQELRPVGSVKVQI